MAKRIRLKMRDAGACRTRDASDDRIEVAIFRGQEYIAENVGEDIVIRAIIYSETKGIQKTWVANYGGRKDFRYVAERDGEDLIIYAIKDGGAKPGALTTSDSQVRDSLRSIRDNKARMDDLNKAASDFWGDQRKAQDAAFK